MNRKFLFEIIDDVKKSNDKKKSIKEWTIKNRYFRDFMDIIYGEEYSWEFDEKYNKEARNQRKNGGVESQWCEVVMLMRRTLVKNTNQSPNFFRRLDRALENCNQNDIDIILYALKKRMVKGWAPKTVRSWLEDVENDEDK